MAGTKGKSGGKREGSGRPSKGEGCPSKVMRVPMYMVKDIEILIKIQNEWIAEDENKRPLDYLSDEEERQRRNVISTLEGIIYYEKGRLERAYKRKAAREEEKRQLKLFEEDI